MNLAKWKTYQILAYNYVPQNNNFWLNQVHMLNSCYLNISIITSQITSMSNCGQAEQRSNFSQQLYDKLELVLPVQSITSFQSRDCSV